MKKILIIALLFLSMTGRGQEMFLSGDTTFERQCIAWDFSNVIVLDSTINKDKAFQIARQWFSEVFESSKSVLENADKEAGILYGRGNLPTKKSSNDGYINFSIEIRCKDGKIRYRMYSFNHRDAWTLSLFGLKGRGSTLYDMGPLAGDGLPKGMNVATTGRSNDYWLNMKFYAKKQVYYFIQNLQRYMTVPNIQNKDSW